MNKFNIILLLSFLLNLNIKGDEINKLENEKIEVVPNEDLMREHGFEGTVNKVANLENN